MNDGYEPGKLYTVCVSSVGELSSIVAGVGVNVLDATIFLFVRQNL